MIDQPTSPADSRGQPDPARSGEPAALRRPLTFGDFQQLIDRMYSRKDEVRGVDGTFMWLMEEVGELAAALREGTPGEIEAEFADVLAWLATIANVAGIDLERAVLRKYGSGCPGCGRMVCECGMHAKP
ncbi:MAG: MazG nucleotide pyrophosphohydrolase domain-containing protein [Planctomycetales bacterium]